MDCGDHIKRHHRGYARKADLHQSRELNLHRHPELSFQEYDTTAFIAELARKLRLKLIPTSLETGLLAELSSGRKGPTIAVRTDIDALPVKEKTGLKFESRNAGLMHACGHDMHMAVVLGAAAVLAGLRDRFTGKVRFIFQPGEEKPPGGARPMIAAGALKDVEMILGLHVDPDLPTGTISLRDGPVMASVYDFDLVIHGRGGHAARPHSAVDAIATAAEVIDSIQKIVSREINPVSPAAITFGRIEGGTARNIVADRVTLTGTARVLDPALARSIPKLIKRSASGVCRARGAKCEMREIASYPVLKNHRVANELMARNYSTLFGARKIRTTDLVLGGEDFACYVDEIPGAMFRLGIRNKKLGADKPWHSPEFIADEEALVYGTSLIVSSVMDFLGCSGQ